MSHLVHVADTECHSDETSLGKIHFAINRPRQEPKQPQKRKTLAEDKGLYQLLEALSDFSSRVFSCRLIIHKVDQLQQRDKLPRAEFQWTITQIAQACNDFYQPILNEELKLIKQRQYASPDWVDRMDKFLTDLDPLLRDSRAMLLRVGRHSGAESVPLNGVRKIKIMQGQGRPPRFKGKPQTLWLAANTQQARSEMVPFGWILLEIDPPDTLSAGLTKFTEQTDAAGREWYEKQQDRIADLQNKLDGRKRQEETQKMADLAERQAEQEKREQRACMSNEQRAIAELREQFELARDNRNLTPQSIVPNRLVELLKQAGEWPEQDKVALCNLAEEIYKPLDMLRGKKGRERKERIRQLRGSN